MTTAGNQFADLLKGVGAAGASSARRTARPNDLRLEVRDVGPITFPVPVTQAKQLCLVGRPARFGKGEQTLLDRGVRDTWEIPRSRIKIDKRQWDRTLRPTLDALRADLGLPAECTLTAEFHAMLVYGPGQFFAPHQDSEKTDTMIGTLVVTLPSNSTGGALVVDHSGASTTYRSSKTSLSFIAFYADCRHEVRPVTSGYRIALTYNLLLGGDTTSSVAAPVDPDLTRQLTGHLDTHFTTRRTPRYSRVQQYPPTRLVYLLDHEYTERGLSWARLKGTDSDRAAVVKAAAEKAGCEAVLALAEVHETWQANDEYDYYDDADEEPTDARHGEPESQELIDSTVRLDRWLNAPDGPATPTSLTVSDDEVCATTPSVNLVPYSSEYEGYMGNYGNTMDRWYRRAALVIWPRRLAFANRAEASPEWALEALVTQLRASDMAGALSNAGRLAPFWKDAVSTTQRSELLTAALLVARGLDNPGLATMLLTPFRVETFVRENVEPAVDLISHYGFTWARELVDVWFNYGAQQHINEGARREWVESLPSLAAALGASLEGVALARLLLNGSWAWLRDNIEMCTCIAMPSRRVATLGELGPTVTAVLASTAACASTALCAGIVGDLTQDNDDLLACLIPTLRAGANLDPLVRRDSGLDDIAHHCVTRLTARLARPERAADDWSIASSAGCGCVLCATLDTFLGDPTRRTFDWPLKQQDRQHVHRTIDSRELPVMHQTRRQGRPFTLVLTKTEDLFTTETRQRARDKADLKWLTKTYGDGD